MVTTREGNLVVIKPHEALYFEYSSADRAWKVVYSQGQSYVLKQRTTAEVILQVHHDFVRISKFHIVNLAHVKMVCGNLCVLTCDMPSLRISRNYRKQFLDSFFAL